MVKLFVGDRKRGLIEVTNPEEWRGKFVVLNLNGKPLFSSVLEDEENESDPFYYDHGLCELAVREAAKLSPSTSSSFGGGSCMLTDDTLYVFAGSGSYGRYSGRIIRSLSEELQEAFGATKIDID